VTGWPSDSRASPVSASRRPSASSRRTTSSTSSSWPQVEKADAGAEDAASSLAGLFEGELLPDAADDEDERDGEEGAL
jgi:hypothetical protein